MAEQPASHRPKGKQQASNMVTRAAFISRHQLVLVLLSTLLIVGIWYFGSRPDRSFNTLPYVPSTRGCATHPRSSTWFDIRFNSSASPIWTPKNKELPAHVRDWWLGLQQQGDIGLPVVLAKLFRLIRADKRAAVEHSETACLTCALVGNSGNLKDSGFGREIDGHIYVLRMNMAPTHGFERDVGSITTHHFMYPESAINAGANRSYVIIPFKILDLLWVTSALGKGWITKTYAPVLRFLHTRPENVHIYNPAFMKYVHDHWTNGHGRYPSTGMLAVIFSLHICRVVGASTPRVVRFLGTFPVDVYGFGADERGNWHHYWENNRYAGEFRLTGVHDADEENHVLLRLAAHGHIRLRRPS
uniref:CMP-N-acetylneuraminate-beta-galactosamide- alpha-2,3-sialyltransferase 2 isoform X2 n=1 Tax=Myxine glutinosa TaxID=7769 RepID=UPI00358F2C30